MSIAEEKPLMARQQALQEQASRTADSEPLITDGFQLPDLGMDDSQPPPYGDHHDHVQFSQPGFEAGAAVRGDGRINININTKNRRLADLLAPTIQNQVSTHTEPNIPFLTPPYVPPSLGGPPGQVPPPRLNLVIQIVGSRGDVQPFVALGKVLKDTYGHRVRIATHPTFQNFIEQNGLEFFSIGGDPTELMAFMVKYPGLMPGFDAITSGEVSKRRRGIEEILMGCWRSCIEGGNGLGPAQTLAKSEPLDAKGDLFIAHAIIANPPSFAHIHIAEKLGIPLHMMFPSPALIPKPNDWGRNIDISGFFFLNLASAYTPDPQLEAFLRSGPPPVYIGFGSIVVDDPNAMTRMIFKAIEMSRTRALVSKGWGGLGADEIGLPDNIFMLGNVPHDWLFEHVSCVVHHGGAGTTAAGIKADFSGIGMAIADMPREIFKGIKMATQSKTTQPQLQAQLQPTKPTEQLVLLSHEGDLMTPFVQEPSSSSDHPPSEPRIGTSHSDMSQLSPDASPKFSGSISPRRLNLQRPASQSSKKNIPQASSPNRSRFDAAAGTGRGVGRIVSIGIRSPMNFSLGAAKGFRNIPRLYHDDLIRPIEKVTDLGSGIKVASKGLGYGVFDGVTGLVIQPWKGAEKDGAQGLVKGAQGLVKGLGKGIGGFFMKPAAAYTMQGVHAEINKFFTRNVQNHIISSRTIQGLREAQMATPDERSDVIKRWNNSKFDLKNHYVLKRRQARAEKRPERRRAVSDSEGAGLEAPKAGWLQTKRTLFENRKRLQTHMDSWKKGYVDMEVPEYSEGTSTSRITKLEVESSIQDSIHEASWGNAEDDRAVDATIREHIKAARYRAQSTGSVGTSTKDMSIFDDEGYQIADEEYQDLIEEAIRQSLLAHNHLSYDAGSVESNSLDPTTLPRSRSEIGDESDAELQRAIDESLNFPSAALLHTDEMEELLHAIIASKEISQQELSELTEEEIVMQYVKKQSLAEEEYLQQQMNDGENNMESNGR
ncbi:hypothetical protein G7Z17_g6002 [Cylindrodendrum hubeiense]|uniref:Glycosyltransferase family 28 N-terminal domain-containing protein n=1 Tax=Cylindrodendrum hubeiense TaxID=595255 RepID=A0A9P5H632_9HYPO|nr:hypothetical protein G7Z17_g6002 [Cylindrodendrum hubeiense]